MTKNNSPTTKPSKLRLKPRTAHVLVLFNIVIFGVCGLFLVIFVNHEMRNHALEASRNQARMIIGRNLAIHYYFNTHLKPKVFKKMESSTFFDPTYFDPTWMSSTYAVRQINQEFTAKMGGDLYYKEASIDARSPLNEADELERAFILALRQNPDLNEQSGIREIAGQPFFEIMMRGESVVPPCLRCHSDPNVAPADLVSFYGETRSFGRVNGELVSALSVRIPLSSAYAHADQFSHMLYWGIGAAFLALVLVQSLLIRRLVITPLQNIHDKVVAIVEDESRLGEEVEVLATREFNEVAAAFNTLSINLKHSRENLESQVTQRTKELQNVNELLVSDLCAREAVEEALREANAFSSSVINSLYDELIVIDAKDYRILSANVSFLQRYGFKDINEVLGRTCYEVIHHLSGPCSADCDDCSLIKSVMAGERVVVEYEVKGSDGKRFEEVLASPIKDSDGDISQVVHICRDITTRKKADNLIHEMAYYDSLTGLPNRVLFLDRLNQYLKVAERKCQQVAVLLVDVDRFKNINDSLGHHVGDELLIYVARVIASCVRDMDTVARLSGDEFAIIVGDAESCEGLAVLSQRILDAFLAPIMLSKHQCYSSCSIGISVYPQDATGGSALLKSADIAMYEAKKKGRGCYHFYAKEMDGMALRRLELENGIRRALINDEFFLFFQPQVNLETGKITCLEALIRWQDPIKGLVSPGEFIPLAEETALILSIDKWVLSQACRQCRIWLDSGYSEIKVAINISGLQFKQLDFVDLIDKVLLESGLPAHCLELELTEGHLMDGIETTITTLRKLKDRGIHLAIDDFGTGYSSLSYLKNFPIDRVKIDQSFVRSLPDDDSDMAIIEAIISLARSLDMNVIAEGVETLEQLEFLKNKNCLEMQGYFFSRPCSVEDLKLLLENPSPFHEYI